MLLNASESFRSVTAHREYVCVCVRGGVFRETVHGTQKHVFMSEQAASAQTQTCMENLDRPALCVGLLCL